MGTRGRELVPEFGLEILKCDQVVDGVSALVASLAEPCGIELAIAQKVPKLVAWTQERVVIGVVGDPLTIPAVLFGVLAILTRRSGVTYIAVAIAAFAAFVVGAVMTGAW